MPHPVREERINLGVVLVTDDERQSDFKFTTAYKQKLRALAPDVHVNAVSSFITDFEGRFMRWNNDAKPIDALLPSLETLKGLSSCEGGQIMFTPPRSLVTDESMSMAMRSLFAEYVASLPSRSGACLGKPEVRNTIKQALRSWRVPEHDIIAEPQLPGRLYGNHLDVGVLGTNGSAGRLVAALEPISFQINSTADIERQRDHVAWVKSDLPPEAEMIPAICAVVTSPSEDHKQLHTESLKLFGELGIEVVHAHGIEELRPLLERAGAAVPVLPAV